MTFRGDLPDGSGEWENISVAVKVTAANTESETVASFTLTPPTTPEVTA